MKRVCARGLCFIFHSTITSQSAVSFQLHRYGLELLVAGDIIRTVAVSPTLQNLAVLGLIVLIRTFLSFSLQLEVDGRWPWQHRSNKNAARL